MLCSFGCWKCLLALGEVKIGIRRQANESRRRLGRFSLKTIPTWVVAHLPNFAVFEVSELRPVFRLKKNVFKMAGRGQRFVLSSIFPWCIARWYVCDMSLTAVSSPHMYEYEERKFTNAIKWGEEVELLSNSTSVESSGLVRCRNKKQPFPFVFRHLWKGKI